MRNLALYAVGWILYIAASPDKAEGLSDEEFTILKTDVPTLIFWYLYLQRIGLLKESLPANFYDHFTHEVLPELEKVRSLPDERECFRSALMVTLIDPSRLNMLYQPGGDTYSDMLARCFQAQKKTLSHKD